MKRKQSLNNGSLSFSFFHSVSLPKLLYSSLLSLSLSFFSSGPAHYLYVHPILHSDVVCCAGASRLKNLLSCPLILFRLLFLLFFPYNPIITWHLGLFLFLFFPTFSLRRSFRRGAKKARRRQKVREGNIHLPWRHFQRRGRAVCARYIDTRKGLMIQRQVSSCCVTIFSGPESSRRFRPTDTVVANDDSTCSASIYPPQEPVPAAVLSLSLSLFFFYLLI